ncbi:MAG TPA: hypothetical protein PKO06_08525 [Candidatus Ozemobacteraceae bacterium]|nr:hypothetical protein [Candidatus Ozemobacteraceae bacterium]
MVHDSHHEDGQLTEAERGLTPVEVMKLQLMRDRLNLPPAESRRLLEQLRREIAGVMGVSLDQMLADIDFSGPEMDLVFTFPESAVRGGRPSR